MKKESISRSNISGKYFIVPISNHFTIYKIFPDFSVGIYYGPFSNAHSIVKSARSAIIPAGTPKPNKLGDTIENIYVKDNFVLVSKKHRKTWEYKYSSLYRYQVNYFNDLELTSCFKLYSYEEIVEVVTSTAESFDISKCILEDLEFLELYYQLDMEAIKNMPI